MASSGDDEYGRGKPSTVDFYHGTSAAFDAFRQDKVLLEGANGASENGRGTYFTDTRQQADGWSGRNGGKDSMVLRIQVDADTAQNSFIPHERVFSKNELIDLAAHASLAGFHRTAENFAHLARHENPTTGKDIATRSKYDAGVNEVLSGLGYKGFTYSETNYKNETLGNIIFFNTAEIPPAIPVMTTTYTAMIEKGKSVPEQDVPQSLKDVADKLKQAIQEKGQTLGLSDEKIKTAKDNIDLVTRAAAGMEGYDPLTTVHPMKQAEIAIVEGTKTLDLAKSVRKETEEFVIKGMEATGHGLKPLVFEAQPAAVSDPKTDIRYKDDRTTQLFHQYLQDPVQKIASEELRRGRSAILQQAPAMQEQLDQIIMRLHSPALGGNDGFSMRNSFGVGLKDLARGEITPEDLVKKMEKAAYFANVDMKQYMGSHSLSQSIENLAKSVVAAPAAKAVVKPQPLQVKA